MKKVFLRLLYLWNFKNGKIIHKLNTNFKNISKVDIENNIIFAFDFHQNTLAIKIYSSFHQVRLIKIQKNIHLYFYIQES